jgi:ABC-type transporter Mla subunit MlaD
MASLKEATGAVTDRLEDLVGQLRSELDGGGGDFEKLSGLADQISEAADGLADAFSNVNEQLMQRLDQLKSPGSGNGSSSRRKTSKAGGE